MPDKSFKLLRLTPLMINLFPQVFNITVICALLIWHNNIFIVKKCCCEKPCESIYRRNRYMPVIHIFPFMQRKNLWIKFSPDIYILNSHDLCYLSVNLCGIKNKAAEFAAVCINGVPKIGLIL